MANQPSLDGISKTKSMDGMGRSAAPVSRPNFAPPLPKPARKATPVPKPEVLREPVAAPVAAPKKTKASVLAEAQNEPIEAQVLPAPKRSMGRKFIKIFMILAVLAVLAAGIWWVYISYFA